MPRTLIEKELKSILLNPKFIATFGVCALLILLSVYIGIQDYQAAVHQYETATNLVTPEMREANSWRGSSTRIYRKPVPMQIFVNGVRNDIGRNASLDSFSAVKLDHSNYSDDPIYAVFRFVDLAFIVQIVLSLFAILFKYDAINGEREDGTLKLTFANAVPRVRYILAKFIGAWLGLVLPLLVPLTLGLLLILVFSVPVQSEDWSRLAMLLGVSLLYFTFFVALGILASALTKRSSISFLFLLVTWVTLVLIVPRAGVMVSGQIVRVPSSAEIDAQRQGALETTHG